MLDRRSTPRLRTYKPAQIVFNGRFASYECVIRNLSPRGASLQIASTAGVPNAFRVMFVTEKIEQDCEIVWRSETHIGVVFKNAA